VDTDGLPPCDADTIGLLYYIFLGRDPEPTNGWVGDPVLEVVRGILQSDEFRVIANSRFAFGFVDPEVRKSETERVALVAQLIKLGASSPSSNSWHNMLLSGLQWAGTLFNRDHALISTIDTVIEKLEYVPPCSIFEVDAIRASGLFATDWYLMKYPDVGMSDWDPIIHYLWVGAQMERQHERLSHRLSGCRGVRRQPAAPLYQRR
jgi:hypothetical protein